MKSVTKMYQRRKLVLHASATLHPVYVGLFVLMPLIVPNEQIKNCRNMKP